MCSNRMSHLTQGFGLIIVTTTINLNRKCKIHSLVDIVLLSRYHLNYVLIIVRLFFHTFRMSFTHLFQNACQIETCLL